jgi:hypothetical protein
LLTTVIAAEPLAATAQSGAAGAMITNDFMYTAFNGMTYTRTWMIKTTEQCYHDLQLIEPSSCGFTATTPPSRVLSPSRE